MKANSHSFLCYYLLLILLLFLNSCEKQENQNSKPICKIQYPLDGQEIGRGEDINIEISAVDDDGSINRVTLFVDNNEEADDNTYPYSFNWSTSTLSLSTHQIKVTAFDNEEASDSDEINISIIDGGTIPIATFKVSTSSGTIYTNFIFDASESTDEENPEGDLLFRWDFEGDGNWDTNYSIEKIISHKYESEGDFMPTLQVRDSELLTATHTETISVKGNAFTYTDPRDSKTYQTINIGDQTWFAENLNFETSDSWELDDNSANGAFYGRLYTWQSARNSCPTGWHLPNDDEWKELELAIGMSQSQVDALLSRGNNEGALLKTVDHWGGAHTSTNETGFSALPGSNRDIQGGYIPAGDHGYWWTSSESTATEAWFRMLKSVDNRVFRFYGDKDYGYSVRCIED